MVCKSTFVAGALLMLAAAASPASAVTVGPHSVAPAMAEGSLVQLAQFRYNYCARVRSQCAAEWPWRSRGYFYCVRRRGC